MQFIGGISIFGFFNFIVSGIYMLIYINVNECGMLIEMFEFFVQFVLAVELVNDIMICFGQFVQFNFVEDENIIYIWIFIDLLFSDFNNFQLVVIFMEIIIYILIVSNGVCDDFVGFVMVEVIGNILLDILFEDFFICLGSFISIIVQVVGGSSEEIFIWIGSDGIVYIGDSIMVMLEDFIFYIFVYESGGGCIIIIDFVFIEVGDGVFLIGVEIIQEVFGDFFEGDLIILGVNYGLFFDFSQLNFIWMVFYQDFIMVILLASGFGFDII